MLPRLARPSSGLAIRHCGFSTVNSTSSKSVLVTGGALGLGEAISRRLRADGFAVFVADVDAERGSALADELGGTFLRCDVTQPGDVDEAVRRVVESSGSLDALVTSAGVVGSPAPLGECEIDEWRRVIDVNLNGTFYCLKYALAQIATQSTGGGFVALSSTAGFRGMCNLGPYTATKWAVRGLVQMAAAEYAQKNIRVNAIAPTTCDTPMVRDLIASAYDPALTEEMCTAANAQPGMVQPEDVAAAAAFLLSDDARFITGHTLPVDAGTLSRMPNARDGTAVQP